MRDNIMITFANQKGGVGKTTLCTMFADYLAAKGESVLVVDFDRQQTIYSKRKEDVEKYRGVRLPYTVQPFDIKDTNNVREFLTSLREGYKGIVLMDTPGNLSQQGLVPIFALRDLCKTLPHSLSFLFFEHYWLTRSQYFDF